MKTIMYFIACFLVSGKMTAQIKADSTREIEITFNKTSSLVFPSEIKSVDRGSRDILAQIVKGSENVLQLKAAVPGFVETNLTVITADQLLHQFRITYSQHPASLFHSINTLENQQPILVQFKADVTDEEFQTFCNSAIEDKNRMLPKWDRKHKIKLSLSGIYVHDNVMLYKLQLVNRSNINFDFEYLSFFIKDKVQSKRTASQELKMTPLYVHGNVAEIKGNSTQTIVFAFQKFTIPDTKRLTIEVFENNGGRHLHLKIKNARIVKAKLI